MCFAYCVWYVFRSLLNADSYSVFLYFLVAPCVRLCNKRNAIKRRPSLKDLESLLESKLKPIQTQAPHHSRLDALFKKVDDNYKALQARLDSLEARNASLEAENAKLVSKLQFCEASLNNLEQYSRRECVEISGIPETEDENTKEIAIKVGSLIGVHITESDLSVSHLLPKQSYRDS